MISTLYGTLGAATGIAQGLVRAAFGSSKDPAASDNSAGADKDNSTSDLIGEGAPQSTNTARFAPVTLVPIVIVGHSGAGKTTFVHTYLQKQYPQPAQPTVGADLSIKQVCLGQHVALLQIWDVAGEKQAHLLDAHFWGNAAGAVIVCNVAQAGCIHSLDFWQQKVCQEVKQGMARLPIVVVATKHKTDTSSLELQSCQHEGLCISKWCEDNNRMLFTMASMHNRATAEMAVQSVASSAVQFLKHS